MAFVNIISPGRSGSSLVAKIFAEHGLRFGETRGPDRWNQTGYYENIKIKDLVIKHFGRPYFTDLPLCTEDFYLDLEKVRAKQGLTFDPGWGVKIGALYLKVFEPYRPLRVKVFRPLKDVMESYSRCRFLHQKGVNTPREREFLVRRQHDIMAYVPGMFVHTNELVNGDYSEMTEALKAARLDPDQNIIKDCIKEELFTKNEPTNVVPLVQPNPHTQKETVNQTA